MSVANGASMSNGFALVAKQLITGTQATKGNGAERLTAVADELSAAGLSKEYTFRVIKDIIDSCEDDEKPTKLAGAKLLVQMHGMLTNDEKAAVAPTFNLVIQGDNVKVNSMLCPGYTS